MSKIFDKSNVIILKVNENELMSFLLSMDIDDEGKSLYPLDMLTSELMNVIPEYVFAQYEDPTIPLTEIVPKLKEAANSIYKIKEFDLMRRVYLSNDSVEVENAEKELARMPYRYRGEFGELLLHFLLRDFKSTIPLISKVYFKDSTGVPAHGFDAVHISPDEGILWLGESKLYKDGKLGIDSLIKDLNEHLKTDYLNEQFLIIKKNLTNNSIPQRDEWIQKISSSGQLKDKLSMINIPMLCTYEHDIYSKIDSMSTDEFNEYYLSSINELKAYFDKQNTHPLRTHCNIILLLFPIRNKDELIKKLHERLWHMQSI